MLDALYLYNNQLTGTLPTTAGMMSSLRSLEVQANQIGGPIPSELAMIQNLSEFFVAYRGEKKENNEREAYTFAIPSTSLILTSQDIIVGFVAILNLDANQLTGQIPSELGNLSALRMLWLSQNLLTGTVPTSLVSLTDLCT